MLPLVRELDPSRMVMLNSGRWDEHGFDRHRQRGRASASGPRSAPREPWVAINRHDADRSARLGITWPAGHLAFHPGPANEFSVVRWTAPAAGDAEVAAAFTGLAERATTDVHVLHNGRPLFDGVLNLERLAQRGPLPQDDSP